MIPIEKTCSQSEARARTGHALNKEKQDDIPLNKDVSFTKKDLEKACLPSRLTASKATISAIERQRKELKMQQDRILNGDAVRTIPTRTEGRVGEDDKSNIQDKKSRTTSSGLTKSWGPSSSMSHQMRALDQGVKLFAQKVNQTKDRNDVKERELSKKIDEFQELVSESDALDELLMGKNPEARSISKLQQQLKDEDFRLSEIVRYSHILKHMFDCVKYNSMRLDSQMSVYSDQLTNSVADLERCKRMVDEIQAICTKARQSLDLTRADVHIQREHRRAAVESLRIEAANAELMEVWRIEREGQKEAMFEESFTGGQSKEEKELKIRMVHDLKMEAGQLRKNVQKQTTRLEECEEITKHIVNSTGVKSLEELVSKLQQYRGNISSLNDARNGSDQKNSEAKQLLFEVRNDLSLAKAEGIAKEKTEQQLLNVLIANSDKKLDSNKTLNSDNDTLKSVIRVLEKASSEIYEVLEQSQRVLAQEPMNANEAKFREDKTSSTRKLALASMIMSKIFEEGYNCDQEEQESEASKKSNQEQLNEEETNLDLSADFYARVRANPYPTRDALGVDESSVASESSDAEILPVEISGTIALSGSAKSLEINSHS